MVDTTQGFAYAIDDNRRDGFALKPKTGERITGIETSTYSSALLDSGVVRLVATAAINYSVTSSTTDAVTTSDAYLPANTVEYVKVDRAVDYVRFMGSSVVYILTMK